MLRKTDKNKQFEKIKKGVKEMADLAYEVVTTTDPKVLEIDEILRNME